MRYFLLWVGLTLGNLLYYLFSDITPASFVERAYFQAIALIGAWIVDLVAQRSKKETSCG